MNRPKTQALRGEQVNLRKASDPSAAPERNEETGTLKFKTYSKKPNLRHHLKKVHKRPKTSKKETRARVAHRPCRSSSEAGTKSRELTSIMVLEKRNFNFLAPPNRISPPVIVKAQPLALCVRNLAFTSTASIVTYALPDCRIILSFVAVKRLPPLVLPQMLRPSFRAILSTKAIRSTKTIGWETFTKIFLTKFRSIPMRLRGTMV
ncbi:hypothetical protein B0T21DRAFT_345893 [Apiosordaria backusii]|uniref:Uncharacterized protein n=1 Tax=Apiosordaria backusii TaxID=314023 RepID=A0AA40EMG1_9PEZI|nr:hypothetical protein B0T21DRAFT_345893 [Apiosordaria backusii]